jgi:hypothetical protein
MEKPVTDEQMLILWLVIAAFIAFAAWKLTQNKDVIFTLAITDKVGAAPCVLPEQKHHGFSPA